MTDTTETRDVGAVERDLYKPDSAGTKWECVNCGTKAKEKAKVYHHRGCPGRLIRRLRSQPEGEPGGDGGGRRTAREELDRIVEEVRREHPAPWRLVTAFHEESQPKREPDEFLGYIEDADGERVYRGPNAFRALTDAGARQVVEAVNEVARRERR